MTCSNARVFLLGYREADGLTALSIAAGKKHKPITEMLASKCQDLGADLHDPVGL